MPSGVVTLPIDGLNMIDPLAIPPQNSPNLQNVRLELDAIRKRPAITAWAVDAKRGRTIAQGSFSNATVPSQLLMFDEAKLYRWNAAAATWDLVAIAGDISITPMDPEERFSVANTLGAAYWTSWNQVIRQYDGISGSILAQDLDLSMRALGILAFANRLVLIRTREFTLAHPTRVRWCANGDPSKFDPALSDGCGFLEIVEGTNHPLTGGFVINNRAFVTKEREIIELIFDPSPSRTFRQEGRQFGIGMIAPNSWASSDYFGFFLGPDSVYQWDGNSLKEIGRPVKKEIFDTLDVSKAPTGGPLQAVLGRVVARNSQYWLMLPDQRVFIYDYRRERWSRDDYSSVGEINCFEEMRPAELALAGGARPELDELIIRDLMMINLTGQIRQPSGATSPGHATYVQDYTRFSDQEPVAASVESRRVPIDCYFETRDYFAQDFQNGRAESSVRKWNTLQRVEFKADPGSRVMVGVSSDLGENWVEREATVMRDGTGVSHFIFPFQTVRIRLRSVSENEPFRPRGAIAYVWKQAGQSQVSG